MDDFSLLPDTPITPDGEVSRVFLGLGVGTFHKACGYVKSLPYGYNSDRDAPLILFKEGKGTCTTKHAVIASLAGELDLPVVKCLGVYAMTPALVNGVEVILARYGLPFLPMLHCFLRSGEVRVDLTEGNRNGKNGPVDEFLFTKDVGAMISAKEEYLIYRRALAEVVLPRPEFSGVALPTVLHARVEGIELLRSLVAGG